MAVLTLQQLAQLIPPRPPGPEVQLVDPRTGKPTAAFVNYLQRLDQWQRRLIEILGA